jgi:hypothetical protein
VEEIMRYHLLVLIFLTQQSVSAQRQLNIVVADSLTKHGLPFATIRLENQDRTLITGINGQCYLHGLTPDQRILISYVSYQNKAVVAGSLNNGDTIFLASAAATLGEVIVRPQQDRIRRIVSMAIRNKSSHNPELYDRYQCNIYYKMKLDIVPVRKVAVDSAGSTAEPISIKRRRADGKKDTSVRKTIFGKDNYLLISETYSRRYYRRPQQLQDVVIASRFSGLKKTYFANLVTEVLPFHVYSDYIPLNGNDYSNPIARGWQQRYEFFIEDEISHGADTTFILSFQPKKSTGTQGLKGLVYINNNGYAISHFIASTTDTASNREIRLEQVYQFVHGKWFPAELNYDLIFGTSKDQPFSTQINGHSIIDWVSFARTKEFRFNRAYTAKLHDSVDLRSSDEWRRFRRDSLSQREINTYHLLDSISKAKKLEKIIAASGKIGLGRLPIGKIDLDLLRLISSNDYEGTRLGAGLYTNEKLSRFYSIGGWAGYGLRDRVVKYGVSGTFYLKGNRDNWVRVSHENDYQNAGNIRIHRDIDRGGYRNWLLAQVDHKKEYSLTAHAQTGYLEIEILGLKQKLESRYENNFQYGGKFYNRFSVKEISLGLRFAYGEKRIPLFGFYFPIATKYPIFYFRTALGEVKSAEYSAPYLRALMGFTYSKRVNRWGKDNLRIEAGFIQSLDNKPFSRSLLLAAKGFRTDGLNYYAWGGFLTFRAFDFFNDRYLSVLYKHDFEKNLWKLKWSKPYISIAHNMMYGGLDKVSKDANPGIATTSRGYHESGFLLNQLLQKNFFGTIYLYLNAGIFYHWTNNPTFTNNGQFVIGISTGF